MADQKISELTDYTTPLDADLLAIVDTANTQTKKLTVANLEVFTRGFQGMVYMGSNSIATPADATSYYFGAPGYSGSTATGYFRHRMLRSGTIVCAIIDSYYSGTQPTNETSTVYLKVNGGGAVTVINGTFKNDVNAATFSNFALNTSVAQGDAVEFMWTTPTWTTNLGTSIILKNFLLVA
ncbi:MAG: hypothetical protein WC917_03215 [Bacilli bacterium]|jgi:hypothetical protein